MDKSNPFFFYANNLFQSLWEIEGKTFLAFALKWLMNND